MDFPISKRESVSDDFFVNFYAKITDIEWLSTAIAEIDVDTHLLLVNALTDGDNIEVGEVLVGIINAKIEAER